MSEPLVQTHEVGGDRQARLVRECLALSGPVQNPARHQKYLLTLRVDVLQQRLAVLLVEKSEIGKQKQND